MLDFFGLAFSGIALLGAALSGTAFESLKASTLAGLLRGEWDFISNKFNVAGITVCGMLSGEIKIAGNIIVYNDNIKPFIIFKNAILFSIQNV